MLHIDIITIFPEVIEPYAKASILGRAQKEKLVKIQAHQLRKYSPDRHHKVDDTPYGGGAGMIMSVPPFDEALQKIRLRKKLLSRHVPKTRVILTSASGKRFTQDDAWRLGEDYDQIIFLCGRYEGIDHRVEEALADEIFSVGDYVLTGGELPALTMADAVTRLIPGVLGNPNTLHEESHDEDGFLEYPQYTKPENYVVRGQKGAKVSETQAFPVPEVLLSGHHALIGKWRQDEAEKRSRQNENSSPV